MAPRTRTTCSTSLPFPLLLPQAFVNSPAVAAALDGGPTAGPWRLAALLAAHTVPGRALLKAQLIGGTVLVSAAGAELRVRRTRWERHLVVHRLCVVRSGAVTRIAWWCG